MKLRKLMTTPPVLCCEGCGNVRKLTHTCAADPVRWFCADCARRLECGEKMTTFYRTHLPTGKTTKDERFFSSDAKALETIGRWNDMGGKVWEYTLNP